MSRLLSLAWWRHVLRRLRADVGHERTRGHLMTDYSSTADIAHTATIERAVAQIRNDRGGVVSKQTVDGHRWLAVATWLEDTATSHARDDEPVELVLHYDEECPTGECEDPGYHDCIVCTGCWPMHDGMEGRSIFPCQELMSAYRMAQAYLSAEEVRRG